MPSNPLQEIQKHKDAIAKLTDEAVAELNTALVAARAEVSRIESEIEALGGKPKKAGASPTSRPDVPSVAKLKEIVNAAEGNRAKRMDILNAGYNLKSAIALAQENKDVFGAKKNGAQGEIWFK